MIENVCGTLKIEQPAVSNFDPATDPRLAQFVEMRLSPAWLAVAFKIGYDRFLMLWSLLDESNHGKSRDEARLRLSLFRVYRIYKWNQWIRSLFATGMPAKEIKKQLAREGASLSAGHINRLSNATQ